MAHSTGAGRFFEFLLDPQQRTHLAAIIYFSVADVNQNEEGEERP